MACGSGGPALHLARLTECKVVGVELYGEAVMSGHERAREAGLEMRASFVQADASRPLQFDRESFDAILCVDAINHLPGRPGILADWARLLRPGARLLFTDPVTVTGVLGSDEIAIRSSIGYFLFVPPGENERLLIEAGLSVLAVEDTTEHSPRSRAGGLTRAQSMKGPSGKLKETRHSKLASDSSRSLPRWRASAASRVSSTWRRSRRKPPRLAQSRKASYFVALVSGDIRARWQGPVWSLRSASPDVRATRRGHGRGDARSR